MDTKPLEKFAQAARRQLHEQVKAKLEQVLRTDSPELRAKAKVVSDLNKEIAQSSRQEVVERVAYTWFNRFCALRYMDANHYTRLGIVSPAPGNSQPEILQEAKAGHIDSDLTEYVDSQRVLDLLSGRLPSADGQAEAYRLLLVGSCNQYNKAMPFLFQKIDDYTELLMPDDLLSSGSVLAAAREVLTEKVCEDVEVIGWLYQFYISEKKDEVIGAKKAITTENIPAATQLFTPDWIVRYLVQNSLGRLWLLNRPHSRLAEQMEFYIAPDLSFPRRASPRAGVGRESTDLDSEGMDARLRGHDIETLGFLRVNSPEELTVCDPAVGSGHMLTYAFELLYAIYEEEGYNAPNIPRLILEKNLTGLEIDERAGALAAFALVMKARAKDRRFFRREVAPHITVLRPIVLSEAELDAEVAALSKLEDSSPKAARNDMEIALRHDLNLFREADNFGSLLRPMLSAAQLTQLHDKLSAVAQTGQLQMFDQARRQKAKQAIEQAIPLAQQYDVVIANPPYMGSRNINDSLKNFASDNYPESKSDLFAMFIERGFNFATSHGYNAMVTMQSWMFLSSYEKLREKLLDSVTIDCMVHMDNMVMGIAFGTAATVWQKQHKPEYKGHFSYVYYEDLTPENKPREFPIQNDRLAHAAATDFKKIPGSPIAYWVSDQMRKTFESGTLLESIAEVKHGLSTGKNAAVVRFWAEISRNYFGINLSTRDEALQSGFKWFPYNKGGAFRRWYGNNEYVLRYDKYGNNLMNSFSGHRHDGKSHYFLEGVTWTFISSSNFGVRYSPKGFVFDVAGSSLFVPQPKLITAFLCTKLCFEYLGIMNPTLNFQVGNLKSLPILEQAIDNVRELIEKIAENAINLVQNDWDAYETSWDFSTLPLLQSWSSQATLAATYTSLRQQWQAATLEMQRLEEENNRLFIEAYGLQDELTPDVPLSEITLTCNPYYRYNANKTEAELDALLLADTMREFISYAVGCMFGRYSLDKPGLILASQGETLADYLQNVFGDPSFTPHPSAFLPDADNAIPMLDGDWFPDDITERFKKFLRITFGEAHYAENLAFIESALGRDIRNYFLREFYDHHVKLYKKRPIYWLFSSAKGSFNVLIYMHRYKPDTVSVVLNDYLREFRAKLTARKNHLESVSVSAASSASDKTRALKEISNIDKTLKEIREYEDDVLYPLATRQVQIDLDDGVKVNYNKFGKALKKVTGLTAK